VIGSSSGIETSRSKSSCEDRSECERLTSCEQGQQRTHRVRVHPEDVALVAEAVLRVGAPQLWLEDERLHDAVHLEERGGRVEAALFALVVVAAASITAVVITADIIPPARLLVVLDRLQDPCHAEGPCASNASALEKMKERREGARVQYIARRGRRSGAAWTA